MRANAIPALVNILKPDKGLLPEEENSVQRMELKMQTSGVIKFVKLQTVEMCNVEFLIYMLNDSNLLIKPLFSFSRNLTLVECFTS